MNTRFNDCLLNKDPNYLYPFFIVRDMSREDYIEEIEAIYNSGCGGFLIENRGHTDFGGPHWWDDMDLVMQEAKKRNMKVWLTDDISVPSGKANWAIHKEHPELRRQNLVLSTVDVVGPVQGCCYQLDGFLQEGESVLLAIAYKLSGTDEALIYEQPIVLTENIKDNLLFWDVPDGYRRLFLIIRSQTRGVPNYLDYVDYLNPKSCELMISHVYEPHYERYKEYAGNTWEGFFTDEPLFGNMSKPQMDYCEKIGKESAIIPWRDSMIEEIADLESWTYEETLEALPGLWHDIGGKTQSIRRRYMDIVTEAYKTNFVNLLGKWCGEHGLLYTGHILEDMNAHMRLGYSTGHFFRSQEGQHTAGFDLVLQQLKVGSRPTSP